MRRIAARLEEAYATKPLPPATEPDRLADRLTRWKGFRECAARTYAVLRSRSAASAAAPSLPPSARLHRHASIGDAAVEECAVQGAVADKDAALCRRLASDFAGPRGEPTLAALRCWDTRARVLGLPDECPVLEIGRGTRGRNPECLAAARRDPSLCTFADDPPRCRAILTSDVTSCAGGAANCKAAVTYWSGLIPRGQGPPLVSVEGRARLILVDRDVTLTAPPSASAVSWPTAASEVASLAWGDDPAVRLAFSPLVSASGTRRFGAEPGTPPAGLSLQWRDGRSCAASSGTVRFDAHEAKPGALLSGEVTADLRCTDGTTTRARGDFEVVVIDVR